MAEYDYSRGLLPAKLVYHPDGIYLDSERMWQGIPAVERTKAGRIFAAYYSGNVTELPGNFVNVVISDDNGETFGPPYLSVTPAGPDIRCYDECLWMDPQGRFHLFWAQSCHGQTDGREGVWESICMDPDAKEPVFSEPRRIANGIMMNKPIVLSTGEWLLTCGIYEGFCSKGIMIPEERFSNVYISGDDGATFTLLSHTAYADRLIDEHMNIERKDGSVWMLIRGAHGIGQAFSYDKGKTWTECEDSGLGGPCSRFCIRRLKSGRMLLINHHDFEGRNNLKAMLSDDEGKTWQGFLMIDARSDVSYPDMTQGEDGTIYLVWDHSRYGDKEILLGRITEADILAGKPVTPGSVLGNIVSKALKPLPETK